MAEWEYLILQNASDTTWYLVPAHKVELDRMKQLLPHCRIKLDSKMGSVTVEVPAGVFGEVPTFYAAKAAMMDQLGSAGWEAYANQGETVHFKRMVAP